MKTSRIVLVVLALGLLSGIDACEGAAHVRFDLTQGPMDFGAIPFPDDLYLDSAHRVELGRVPGEGVATIPGDTHRRMLKQLDGFGVTSPIYFYFDKFIDPASIVPGSNVFLFEVAGGASAPRLVPIEWNWQPTKLQLAIRPAMGHVLAEKTAHVVVITRGVKSLDGTPIEPSAKFAELLAPTFTSTDPRTQKARLEYAYALAALGNKAPAPSKIASMAVFTTQTVTKELLDARVQVRARTYTANLLEAIPAGPELDRRLGVPTTTNYGIDSPGGMPHSHVGWMIHGTFMAPSFFLDANGKRWSWARDAQGKLIVRSDDKVYFTIWLPKTGSYTQVKFILGQHGLPGDRFHAVPWIDSLTALGYAVVAIDAPLQGMRARQPNVDTKNSITGEMVPDNFAEAVPINVLADFYGIFDTNSEAPNHPALARESFRQTVLDQIATIELLSAGNLSAIRSAAPALAQLSFNGTQIGYIGQSGGAYIGCVTTAIEPRIRATVLAAGMGPLMRWWWNQPEFLSSYAKPIFAPLFGLDIDHTDQVAYPFEWHPEVALWQMQIDRGDALAFAPLANTRSTDVLATLPEFDEYAAKEGGESVALAFNTELAGGVPQRVSDLTTTTFPVSGNIATVGGPVTRASWFIPNAGHGAIGLILQPLFFAHPLHPPYVMLATPTYVVNPVNQVVDTAAKFVTTGMTGTAVLDPN